MNDRTGAWVQSFSDESALFRSGDQLLPVAMAADREDLIRKISHVTSTGVVAACGNGITAYLAATSSGGHDAVVKVPRRGQDANGRTVLGSLLIEDHQGPVSELTEPLEALRTELCRQGIDLVSFPADMGTRLSALRDHEVSAIAGCLRGPRLPGHRLRSLLSRLRSRLPQIGGR